MKKKKKKKKLWSVKIELYQFAFERGFYNVRSS